MGWRDKFKVHPVADLFPMMSGDELAELQNDIEGHGVRVPIGLFDERDAQGKLVATWLIDGRNRLEAAEQAGINIKNIPHVHVHCSDPITWIIALNIRRRHLDKQQIAHLIIEAHRVAQAEELKRKADNFSPTWRENQTWPEARYAQSESNCYRQRGRHRQAHYRAGAGEARGQEAAAPCPSLLCRG